MIVNLNSAFNIYGKGIFKKENLEEHLKIQGIYTPFSFANFFHFYSIEIYSTSCFWELTPELLKFKLKKLGIEFNESKIRENLFAVIF